MYGKIDLENEELIYKRTSHPKHALNMLTNQGFLAPIFPRCHALKTQFEGEPSKYIAILKSAPKKPYSTRQ